MRQHVKSYQDITGKEGGDIKKWSSGFWRGIVEWDYTERLISLVIALQIFLTMFVSVASCEQSFSKLKLIQEAQLLLGWPTVLPYSRRLCKSCGTFVQIGPADFS